MDTCSSASVSAAVWFPWDLVFYPNGRKWNSATGNASKHQVVCKREAWSLMCIHYFSLAAMLDSKKYTKQNKNPKPTKRFSVRVLARKNRQCPTRFSPKNSHFMVAGGMFCYWALLESSVLLSTRVCQSDHICHICHSKTEGKQSGKAIGQGWQTLFQITHPPDTSWFVTETLTKGAIFLWVIQSV